MGESQARRWRWLGTWHFFRNRGRDTLDTTLGWAKVGVIGAPAAKYLGFSTEWAIAFGVGIVVGAEVAMLALGWFDKSRGVIEQQQRLNNAMDPWKIEMLELVRGLARSAPSPARGETSSSFPMASGGSRYDTYAGRF